MTDEERIKKYFAPLQSMADDYIESFKTLEENTENDEKFHLALSVRADLHQLKMKMKHTFKTEKQ